MPSVEELLKYNIYPSFRKYQYETIDKAINFVKNSSKRFLVIQAPTGSGKSIIGYAIARWCQDNLKHNMADGSNKPFKTFLSTSKNLLLDQYDRDFHNYIAIMKGRANYPCKLTNTNAAEAFCRTQKSISKECISICPYLVALRKAVSSPIMVTNLNILLSDKRKDHYTFEKRDLLIADECHAIENTMIQYSLIPVTEAFLKKVNNTKRQLNSIPLPDKREENRYILMAGPEYRKNSKESRQRRYFDMDEVDIHSLDSVTQFLSRLKLDMNDIVMSLSDTLDGVLDNEFLGNQTEAFKDKEFKDVSNLIIYLENMIRTLKLYLDGENQGSEWIVQEHITDKTKQVTGFDLKPLDVKKFAVEFFNRFANKIILMSATTGGVKGLCNSLGIDPNDAEYLEVPSTFPIENRPFMILPVAKMNYANMENNLPLIVEACDNIISGFPSQKGIIHSVSFKNAIYLKEHSQYSNRIIIHDSRTKEERVKQFINSKNKVLVSPSLIEGFDFKGSMSEFQIFIKVPYLSLGDKATKRRMEVDPDWYQNYAALSIMQGVGRSIRSETDSAITFCLDENIEVLLHRYKYLFSEDFLSTIMR